MRKIRFFLLLFAFIAVRQGHAQSPDVIRAYINTYRQIAIDEMQRTGVPAAIKLAQGIHETTAGTSDLVIASNNHFGIKCKSTWTGESVFHDDDARGECFRKYTEAAASYRDHSDFLKNSQRYAFLFNLDPLDYAGWANGLKKAGYATNPRYPQIIIRLIEEYQLQDYTLIALGKMSPKEDLVVNTPDRKLPVVPAETIIVPLVRATPQPVYPGGEFRINDTRVIFAKKETSFLALAEQYNIPLSRLFEFNDMDEAEVLEQDQLIYLQRKKKTGNNEFHVVQPGETLQDIAQSEAIRLETLLGLNQLKEFMQPETGEQLYLRARAPSMPRLARRQQGAVME